MGAKAYFLTWTTYGTWLPGDSRCWVDRQRTHGEIIDLPDPQREAEAKIAMKGSSVTLNEQLRGIALNAMLETAAYRGWTVHALEVRSNHVHAVVTALDKTPGEIMRILKAYASRALNSVVPIQTLQWWTRQGSKRNLFTDTALAAAIQYVENQDTTWRKE